MVKRKERLLILLDTNVVVRALTSANARSASARIWQLWLQRRIQLAVSPEVILEYQEVLLRLGVTNDHVQKLVERLAERPTVTRVHLGKRWHVARDPEDDFVLSAADSAQADYLVTLDKDLLELDWETRRRLKFDILNPAQFLEMIE